MNLLYFCLPLGLVDLAPRSAKVIIYSVIYEGREEIGVLKRMR
jgi:hypothetical protein